MVGKWTRYLLSGSESKGAAPCRPKGGRAQEPRGDRFEFETAAAYPLPIQPFNGESYHQNGGCPIFFRHPTSLAPPVQQALPALPPRTRSVRRSHLSLRTPGGQHVTRSHLTNPKHMLYYCDDPFCRDQLHAACPRQPRLRPEADQRQTNPIKYPAGALKTTISTPMPRSNLAEQTQRMYGNAVTIRY
jgi:hypothetical protein